MENAAYRAMARESEFSRDSRSHRWERLEGSNGSCSPRLGSAVIDALPEWSSLLSVWGRKGSQCVSNVHCNGMYIVLNVATAIADMCS